MQLAIATRAFRVPVPVRYALLVILLLGMLVAAALISGVGRRSVPPPFGPAGNGQIGFLSDRSIVLTGVDGSNRVALPSALNPVSGPTFSRDGTRIAFYATDPSGADVLVVANADGSDPRPVGGDLHPAMDHAAFPVWSPDGSQLVFPATIAGIEQLIVARTDGSKAAVIAQSATEGHTFPTFSPNGEWVAFASYPNDGTAPNLQVVHPDGSGRRVLYTGGAEITAIQDLEWAPDSSGRLLFGVGTDTENRLAIVDVDTGAPPTTVAQRPGVILFGEAWSPDGARIASNQSELGSLVLGGDGSNLRVLPEARCAGRVIWSPDGARFTCLNSVALSQGTYELLVVDADGVVPPQHVPFGGVDAAQAAAVFSWQRLAN